MIRRTIRAILWIPFRLVTIVVGAIGIMMMPDEPREHYEPMTTDERVDHLYDIVDNNMESIGALDERLRELEDSGE